MGEGDYYPFYENYENRPGPYAISFETPPEILPFDTEAKDFLNYADMGRRKLYPVHFENYWAKDWGSIKCGQDMVPVASLRECEAAYKMYVNACPTFYRGQGEHPRVIAEYDPFSSLTTLGDYNGKIDANAIGLEREGALKRAREQNTVRILPVPRSEGPSGCYVYANRTALVFHFNPILAHKLKYVETQGYLIDFETMKPVQEASPVCVPSGSSGRSDEPDSDMIHLPMCFLNAPPLN